MPAIFKVSEGSKPMLWTKAEKILVITLHTQGIYVSLSFSKKYKPYDIEYPILWEGHGAMVSLLALTEVNNRKKGFLSQVNPPKQVTNSKKEEKVLHQINLKKDDEKRLLLQFDFHKRKSYFPSTKSITYPTFQKSSVATDGDMRIFSKVN